MDVPVFTSTIGGKVGVKNIAISFRSPQELAFVGQSIPVSVQIQSQGFPRRPVNLVLSKAGQEVGRQEVFLEPDKVVESTFQIAEELTGLYRYEASVEPINEEATADDNRALLLARIVDHPVKMLLVEGKPYWDTKFLVRRLSADQSLDLTSVIRMSEERFMKRRLKRTQSVTNVGDQGTDDAPPVEIGGVEESTIINDSRSILSAAALSEIQILVLGRNAEYFLTDEALDNLRNWIARDGGALVCARGAPSALVATALVGFVW